MLRALSVTMSVWLGTGFACAQEFGGLKVGGSSNAVAGFSGLLGLDSMGRDRMAKFRRPNGHDLSITTRDFGPIVYMESSRNRGVPPAAAPGLQFGVTTRGELRGLLGNDGFTYDTRSRFNDATGALVIFHSYELANQPGVVISFAFRLTADRAGLGEDGALLDSLIVAQASYLDEIWGPGKTAASDYTTVTVNY